MAVMKAMFEGPSGGVQGVPCVPGRVESAFEWVHKRSLNHFGRLFQWLTTRWLKKYFPSSSLERDFWSFRLCPLIFCSSLSLGFSPGDFHSSVIFPVRYMYLYVPYLPGVSENTLRPRQNGCRFADDTFKRIFLNENVRISIEISLKFVPKGPINNNQALVQIMAYLNQWWLVYWSIYASLGLNELTNDDKDQWCIYNASPGDNSRDTFH